MGYLSTGLNNPIVGLVFFFFKKDSWVFYYIRYCVFENVHVLTLFLKDKLAYHSHLTFFFSQNPVDFAILSSGIEYFLWRFLRTIWHLPNLWLLFLSRRPWKSSLHLCFNNFTRIYLSVDYYIMFVLDNMYSLHLKIQVLWETFKKLKTHRG